MQYMIGNSVYVHHIKYKNFISLNVVMGNYYSSVLIKRNYNLNKNVCIYNRFTSFHYYYIYTKMARLSLRILSEYFELNNVG